MIIMGMPEDAVIEGLDRWLTRVKQESQDRRNEARMPAPVGHYCDSGNCDACGDGTGDGADPVSRPPHYTGHPSGVECIEIVREMSFCLGNVVKYCWRAGLKGDVIEDLEKAAWYLNDEIRRLKRQRGDDDGAALPEGLHRS